MIPKCKWCGVRIYPWSRGISDSMFGPIHIQCHIDRNRKVRQIADLPDRSQT